MAKITSLINYVGHKSKIVDQILPLLPQSVGGTFYDCFAGSCVVGLSVSYPRVTFVESNPYLSQLYQDLADPQFEPTLLALIAQYGFTNSSVTPRSQYLQDPRRGTVKWMGVEIPNLHLDQLNRDSYNQLLIDFNKGQFQGLGRSAAYMAATIYGRNSNVSLRPDGTLSGSVGPLDYSIRCSQKLQEHQTLLRGRTFTFKTGSYQDITPTQDDFVYCDPPYLASSFRYQGWDEGDETRLLQWLESLPCPWALSNSLQSGARVNTLLTEFAQRHHVTDINKHYRKWAGSGRDTHTRSTKINREVLVTRDPPTLAGGLIELKDSA